MNPLMICSFNLLSSRQKKTFHTWYGDIIRPNLNICQELSCNYCNILQFLSFKYLFNEKFPLQNKLKCHQASYQIDGNHLHPQTSAVSHGQSLHRPLLKVIIKSRYNPKTKNHNPTEYLFLFLILKESKASVQKENIGVS